MARLHMMPNAGRPVSSNSCRHRRRSKLPDDTLAKDSHHLLETRAGCTRPKHSGGCATSVMGWWNLNTVARHSWQFRAPDRVIAVAPSGSELGSRILQ